MLTCRIILAALMLAPMQIGVPASAGCIVSSSVFVSCEATDDGGDDGSASGAGGSDSDSAPSEPGPEPTGPDGLPLNCGRVSRDVVCVSPPQQTDQPADPGTPAAPAVTISDVESYLPSSATVTMQPATWMLRDAPTNFIVDAPVSTASADLLGRASEVRFTPVDYTFDYGDDTPTTTTTDGGARWEQQNLREFSPTTTSHVYDERGERTITVTTRYTAEYRFDSGPWTSIDGTVSTTTQISGRTVTIDTVLVPDRCVDARRAARCRIGE